MRIAIPLISALLISACANNPADEVVSISGKLSQNDGRYYLHTDQSASMRLTAMPQLDYSDYLGEELLIQGAGCGSTGAATNCLEPQKISLVNGEQLELVYDWQQIDLEDYFF